MYITYMFEMVFAGGCYGPALAEYRSYSQLKSLNSDTFFQWKRRQVNVFNFDWIYIKSDILKDIWIILYGPKASGWHISSVL